MKTVNQIIATDDRKQIVEAIMQLGAAYSRCVASDEVPNPAMPWARIGDQMFTYTSHGYIADRIQKMVMHPDDAQSFIL